MGKLTREQSEELEIRTTKNENWSTMKNTSQTNNLIYFNEEILHNNKHENKRTWNDNVVVGDSPIITKIC